MSENDREARRLAIRYRVAAFVSSELSSARDRFEERELVDALLDRALWIRYAHGVADTKSDEDNRR